MDTLRAKSPLCEECSLETILERSEVHETRSVSLERTSVRETQRISLDPLNERNGDIAFIFDDWRRSQYVDCQALIDDCERNLREIQDRTFARDGGILSFAQIMHRIFLHTWKRLLDCYTLNDHGEYYAMDDAQHGSMYKKCADVRIAIYCAIVGLLGFGAKYSCMVGSKFQRAFARNLFTFYEGEEITDAYLRAKMKELC